MGSEREVKGCEVRKPLKKARNERNGLLGDRDNASYMVDDVEKLFRDNGESLKRAVVAID